MSWQTSGRNGKRISSPVTYAYSFDRETFTGSFATPFSGTTQSVIGWAGPSRLAGEVYKDLNNDGQVDIGENGIPNVTVILSGTDDKGNLVHLSTVTDANGLYAFENLRYGKYTLTETQPSGYTDGKDTVGVGARYVEELLPARPQSKTLHPAAAERNQQLQDVESGAGGIFLGRQE